MSSTQVKAVVAKKDRSPDKTVPPLGAPLNGLESLLRTLAKHEPNFGEAVVNAGRRDFSANPRAERPKKPR